MTAVSPGCAAHGPLAAPKPRLIEGRSFALRRVHHLPAPTGLIDPSAHETGNKKPPRGGSLRPRQTG